MARATLFPGNTLPVVPPLSDSEVRGGAESETDAQAAASKKKRAAAIALLNIIPRPVARVYLSAARRRTSAAAPTRSSPAQPAADAELEAMIAGVEELLSLFDDQRMNRCLVYSVLERVLAEIVPELSMQTGGSVRELLEARGIGGVVAQAEIDELNM